jgi:Uma2 family endonuclease
MMSSPYPSNSREMMPPSTPIQIPPRLEKLYRFLRLPSSVRTLAGFRAWAASPEVAEDERPSFIGGDIFLGGRTQSVRSVLVNGCLTRVVGSLVEELDIGEYYGPGVRFSNVAADLSTVPDALFYSWEAMERERIRLIPSEYGRGYLELEGTPDWIAEVVSAGSEDKDTRLLRTAYHRAGVSEYWIIDVRGEDTIFQILYHRKNGYVEAPMIDGWQKSRVFKREFRLIRKRTRMSHWDFKLEMRP